MYYKVFVQNLDPPATKVWPLVDVSGIETMTHSWADTGFSAEMLHIHLTQLIKMSLLYE